MAMFDEEELLDDARAVRPYTVTRGRVASRRDLPMEALVRAVGAPPAGATSGESPERRRILELTWQRILSVAEIGAYLQLPLGVVRVLVGDLADSGLVVVHTGSSETQSTAAHLKVLGSVLDGISAL
jgi:hypothetical protein